MTEPIKMIEIFSGVGAQIKALDQLPIPHKVIATMDIDKDAILSYAAIRHDLEKEMANYEFPSKEEMIVELQRKNVGFDFVKQKQTITMETNEEKVKQYYIADKLSKNLGDVSLCKELPYVDVIFHSSPCQSFSQAGRGEGGDEGSGTTSSLMWESLRLIGTSMPRFIVWENVAAVLSGKHRHNFIKYLERLSEMGYESAFELLNSKNYGVPQNRLRIFCVSRKIENEESRSTTIRECNSSNKQVLSTMKEIRGKHPNIKIWEDFTFPEPIPLTIRLKDMLEHNVDEKYYLPDDRIEKILNSSFMQEKKRIQTTDVCDTLLARDWKDPKCVPVEEGEIKVVGNYMPSNHDASRVVDVDGIAPTIKENRRTVTAITEPQVDIKERFFRQVAETILENQYEPGDTIDAFNKKVNHSGICPTITTRPEGFKTAILPIVEEQEPFVVASRGRNPENPSDRTTGAPTEQRFEPNFSGTTNCLTSVAKDNYICEPVIIEDFYKSREARIYSETAPTLRSERIGLEVAEEFPCSTRGKQVASAIRASIYKQGARNLEENIINGLGYEGVVEKEQPITRWRIRKLTPVECWRLMGFTDEDHNRAAKYVSASARYKQAGNSIVVNTLVSLFSSLLVDNGYKSEIWIKYITDFTDKSH